MRARLLAVHFAALAAAGCGEATIDVDFDVPGAYEPLVTTVVYSVLTPLEPFVCDGIVWGEVGDDLIDASRLQEVSARRGAKVPLSGIPRLGEKVFYVQGLDEERQPVVAACADLGDVDGDVRLRLVGEPAATVTLPQAAIGEKLPAQVRVVITDVRGEPLGGVPVRWTVVGPAGEVLASPADLASDERGVIMVAPSEPSRPGPNALDIEARWARPAPPSILGYREPGEILDGDLPLAGTVTGGSTDALYAVGRIGPAGEPGFAALGPAADTGQRQALVAYRDGAGVTTATTGAILGALSLGRLAGATRDQVVTMTVNDWVEIRPDGSTPVVGTAGLGRPARRLVTIGACTGAAADHRLLAWTDGGYAAFDDSLQSVTSPFVTAADSSWRLLAGGCVAGPSDPVRAVVYSQGPFVQQIIAEMDGVRTGPWLALPVGATFLPAVGAESPLLIGSTLRIDGASVSRVRLEASTADRLTPIVVGEDDSTSFAISSAGGDLDGDGLGDVASVLTFGESDLVEGVNFRIMVSLGVPHRGSRLVGLSTALVARNPAIFIHDFDEDGTGDLLIATPAHYTVALMHP